MGRMHDEAFVRRVFEAGAPIHNEGYPYIDRTEVIMRLQALGLSPQPELLDELMLGIDTNQDGIIDFAEFYTYYRKTAEDPQMYPGEAEIREMFSFFDEDGNGYLDREEFRGALREVGGGEGLSDVEVDYLFDQADQFGAAGEVGGDGRLDVEEFVNFMMQRNTVQPDVLLESFIPEEVEEEPRQPEEPLPPPQRSPEQQPQVETRPRPETPEVRAVAACVELRDSISYWEDKKLATRARIPFNKVKKHINVSLVPSSSSTKDVYEGRVVGKSDETVKVKWNAPAEGGPPESTGIAAETEEPQSWWDGAAKACIAKSRVRLKERGATEVTWGDRWGFYRVKWEEAGRVVLWVKAFEDSGWGLCGKLREINLTGGQAVVIMLGDFNVGTVPGAMIHRVNEGGCKARLPGAPRAEVLADLLTIATRGGLVHNIPARVDTDLRHKDAAFLRDAFAGTHIALLSYRGDGHPQGPSKRSSSPTPPLNGPLLRRQLADALGHLSPQERLEWRVVHLKFTTEGGERAEVSVHLSELDFCYVDVLRLLSDAFGLALDNIVTTVAPPHGTGRQRVIMPDTAKCGGGSYVTALAQALGARSAELASATGPIELHAHRQPSVIKLRPAGPSGPVEAFIVKESSAMRAVKKSGEQGKTEAVLLKRKVKAGSRLHAGCASPCALSDHALLAMTPLGDNKDAGSSAILNVSVAPLREHFVEGAPCCGLIIRVLTGAEGGERNRTAVGRLQFRCGVLLDVSELEIPAKHRPLALYKWHKKEGAWGLVGAPVLCQAIGSIASAVVAELPSEGLFYIADAECQVALDELWLEANNNKEYDDGGATVVQGGQVYVRPWGCLRKGIAVDRTVRDWACAYCTSEIEPIPWLLAPRAGGEPAEREGAPRGRTIEGFRWQWGSESPHFSMHVTGLEVPTSTPSLEFVLRRSELQIISLLLGSDSADVRKSLNEPWQLVPGDPKTEVPRITVLCRVDYESVQPLDHPFGPSLRYLDEHFSGRTDLEWRATDPSKMKPYGICIRKEPPVPLPELRKKLMTLPHFCGEANSREHVAYTGGVGGARAVTVESVEIEGGVYRVTIADAETGKRQTVAETDLHTWDSRPHEMSPKEEQDAEKENVDVRAKVDMNDFDFGDQEEKASSQPRRRSSVVPKLTLPNASGGAAPAAAPPSPSPKKQEQNTRFAEPSRKTSQDATSVGHASSVRQPVPITPAHSGKPPSKAEGDGGCCSGGCSVQ
eukprot:Hpha_TRINITY_DN15699_c0_g3::TRINITY_DN15699_c0_g3_i2::g.98445::m.98445